MKTRLIAVLMITLMVLTVFSAVAVTAKSTSSASSISQSLKQSNKIGNVVIKGKGGGTGTYDPYLVPIGKNRVWDEKSFNVHDTKITYKNGLVDITCSSVKATLATDVNVVGSPISYSQGDCVAWLGVKFNIAGANSQSIWNFVKNKQVRISTTVDYAFDGSTKISGEKAAATVKNSLDLAGGAYPTQPNVVQNIASMNKPGTISEKQVTTSKTTTLDKLSTGTAGQCQIIVPLSTGAYGINGGTAEASGNVVVTNIQLEWL